MNLISFTGFDALIQPIPTFLHKWKQERSFVEHYGIYRNYDIWKEVWDCRYRRSIVGKAGVLEVTQADG